MAGLVKSHMEAKEIPCNWATALFGLRNGGERACPSSTGYHSDWTRFGLHGSRARSIIRFQTSAWAGTLLSPSNSLVIVELGKWYLADDLRPHLAEDFRAVDTDRLNSLGELATRKGRDHWIGDDEITMITSDRLSAFDVVLSSIPCKGAILNAITLAAFEATKDICPNHIVSSPHPNVLKVRKAEPVAAEIIVRRYITCSLWRDYKAGKAGVYGIEFPADLKKDQRFAEVIITPSTKAPVGEHDEPISREGLVSGGYVEKALLDEAVRKRSRSLSVVRKLLQRVD